MVSRMKFSLHLIKNEGILIRELYSQRRWYFLPFILHARHLLSLSRHNCDLRANASTASSRRNFRNCVVKRLTAILSSSCDESVNEILGNRRIGRSARWSPKGNVSRHNSVLKLAARVGARNRERETTIPWSDCPWPLDRNSGNYASSWETHDIYSSKFLTISSSWILVLNDIYARPNWKHPENFRMLSRYQKYIRYKSSFEEGRF